MKDLGVGFFPQSINAFVPTLSLGHFSNIFCQSLLARSITILDIWVLPGLLS